jgi:hypothetical protein
MHRLARTGSFALVVGLRRRSSSAREVHDQRAAPKRDQYAESSDQQLLSFGCGLFRLRCSNLCCGASLGLAVTYLRARKDSFVDPSHRRGVETEGDGR